MSQSSDEILDELRDYVAGRGRDDNFLYDKRYSPKSLIPCIDFSPWVRKQLLENDIFALAVLLAQFGNHPYYLGTPIPFEEEIPRQEILIRHTLKMPFEEYFTGDVKSAFLDLRIAKILGYDRKNLSRVLLAFDIKLKDARSYVEQYNQRKNTQMELPDDLPDKPRINEFRREFRKLPFATRLHLIDVLEYSKFPRSKNKPLSGKTLYDTRSVGIDPYESANILEQSKLITSYPDGKGHINPDYVETVSVAVDYATKMSPAYYEWTSDIARRLFQASLPDIVALGFQDK